MHNIVISHPTQPRKIGCFQIKAPSHAYICHWTDPPIFQNEVQMWSNQLPDILMPNKATNPEVYTHVITALCWPGKPRMSLPELCSGAFCFPLSSSTIVQCQLILYWLSFSFLSLQYDHVFQITVLSSSVLLPFHGRLKVVRNKG